MIHFIALAAVRGSFRCPARSPSPSLLVATILTAVAASGCLVTPPTPVSEADVESLSVSEADVESLLARLRDGGEAPSSWQATAHVRMPGAEGRGRFLAGDGGRFRLQIDEPLRFVEVHDGDTTWKLYPWGSVLKLEEREEEMSLIPMWVMTGYWLSGEAPVTITAGAAGRRGDVVALEVQHRDGKLPFEVLVGTRLGAPTRVQTARGTPLFVFELDDHRAFERRLVPGTLRVLKSGKATFELELDEPGALASEGGPWERPATTMGAVYDRGISPELESLDDGRGFLFVQPLINGQKMGWFLFDTGAPATILGQAVVKRLDLHELGEARSSGVGGDARIGLHAIDAIQVGPVRVGPVTAAAMDVLRLGWSQLPIEGILGCDVIAQAVVEYDIRAGAIVFHDPATYELPASASWQRIGLHEGKPIARLRFEDHEADFLVDTAASGSFSVSKPLVDHLGLLHGRETRTSVSRGVGGSVGMLSGSVRWLELGGRRHRNVPTRFGESDRGSYARPFPDGIVGIQLIDDYRLVLDLTKRRMAFLDRQ